VHGITLDAPGTHYSTDHIPELVNPDPSKRPSLFLSTLPVTRFGMAPGTYREHVVIVSRLEAASFMVLRSGFRIRSTFNMASRCEFASSLRSITFIISYLPTIFITLHLSLPKLFLSWVPIRSGRSTYPFVYGLHLRTFPDSSSILRHISSQ
jgi:hypothetical protein